MKRIWFRVLVLLLAHAAPLAAQTTDHTDVIVAAKAAAVAAGVDVDSSECARFEVTKRAAVLLAGEGAGLLFKTSGNQCEERSVDIIAYPSGKIFDVLGSGPDGPNTPHWMELTPVDPGRWRAPFDLVAANPQPGRANPQPEPSATRDDHDDALRRIEAALEQLRADLAALRVAEVAEHAQTRAEIQAFREAAKKATNKALELLPSILSGLSFLRR